MVLYVALLSCLGRGFVWMRVCLAVLRSLFFYFCMIIIYFILLDAGVFGSAAFIILLLLYDNYLFYFIFKVRELLVGVGSDMDGGWCKSCVYLCVSVCIVTCFY